MAWPSRSTAERIAEGAGGTALDEQRHSRTKQPIVAASQEERHLEAECGDPISLRPDDTFDEPMQSEAS